LKPEADAVGDGTTGLGVPPTTPAGLDSGWSATLRRWWIIGILVTLVASLLFFYRVIFTPGKFDVHGHVDMVLRFAEGEGGIPGNFLYYLLIYCLSGLQAEKEALWLAATAVLGFATAARFGLDFRIIGRCAGRAPGAVTAPNDPLPPLLVLALTAALTLSFSLPTLAVFDAKPHWYVGQTTPNIWHNSTTILVMPFAIALFWVSYRNLEQPTRRRDLGIAVLCALNIIAKPSFFMVFAPTYTLMLIVRHGLCRETWIRTWPVVLGILTLAAQYYLTFAKQVGNRYRGDSKLTIEPFEIWSHYSQNIPISILASILFPLLHVVIHRGAIRRQPMLIYALALYGVAITMMALLAETGPRRWHANFFWQSYICSHLLFLATTGHLAHRLCQYSLGARERWLLGGLALHVLAGLAYLARMAIYHEIL